VPVTLTYGTSPSKTITCPPNTIIHMNVYAHHHAQEFWDDGPNVAPTSQFYPPRFLSSSSPKDPSSASSQSAPFIRPLRKGVFLPWSLGPRVCPGQKMSQVEFCAVFMTVFRRWRVEVVRKGDKETDGQLKERVWSCLNDSTPRLSMQMNRPRDVELRFVRRDGL
jgi:cytochrome P450